MKKNVNKFPELQAAGWARLRPGGGRATRARQAILQVLSESTDALRPEDIYRRAADHVPGLGLVTVYRTLSLFSDMGWVRRVHQPDGCHGYVRVGLSHGHHLVCRRCQAVVEVPGVEDLKPWIRRVASKTGFAIDDHLLELLGLCPACQGQADA
jgi:Fur family transcriptional regulator, ferric uptake regulator